MPEKYTPEETAKFTESRTLNDAELIKGGAEYEVKYGKPILKPTAEQVEDLRKTAPELEKLEELEVKILSTFTLPDQTEELDFKNFVAPNRLFGSYYLSTSEYEDFRNRVGDMLEPFNGVKGGTFQEVEIPKTGKIGARKIKEKLNIKPISFNEWVYLFSNLTLEQLYGVNYYVVQLDNGNEVTIKSQLNNDGPGPYSYSLTVENITGKEFRTYPLGGGPSENFQPHIIFPTSEESSSDK